MTSRGLLSHWEGEPVRVWRSLWPVPELEFYGSIGSTNDRARELLEGGAAPFTTVVAEVQTRGRGRSGGGWSAPVGKGLLLSLVLRPEEPGLLLTPLILGLAVARAMEDTAALEAAIKWPNDILVGGRKVCGILCESAGGGRSTGVVAGIGVNVGQREEDFTPELRGAATSLELAAGARVSRSALAGALLRQIRALLSPHPRELGGDLAAELAGRDLLRGRRVILEGGGEVTARGIAPDGSLLVHDGRSERKVRAGSVLVAAAGGPAAGSPERAETGESHGTG